MSRSSSAPVKVLVTGAGGFIGHHLVAFLKRRGYWVRGVDLKQPEFAPTAADEFLLLDLRRWENCLQATRGIDEVYALAADMGGMGFISAHHAQVSYAEGRLSLTDLGSKNGTFLRLTRESVLQHGDYVFMGQQLLRVEIV